MNKMKIFYYCPSVQSSNEATLFMPTPPMHLNSYLRVYEPELADKITWQKLQFLFLDTEQLIDKLEKNDIDILCITLYIWNQKKVLDQIANIKTKLSKKITIIVGGPSTEIVRNKNFLEDNPDIDFAVYSQGEKAFADILNHIFDIKKLSLLSSKNVAWRENSKTKIADFEFLRLDKINPYTNSGELLQKIVSDPDYKNLKFTLPYETSRGCPYTCSFCDWTSGLSHKTYFRKFDVEEELEFFAQHGILSFHLSDANFGQKKSDLDVAKAWVKLKETKGYNFKIHNTNFSKLEKKRVFEIVNILLKGEIIETLKFAVQDTHENILNNIERPDIPWLEHKKYMDEVRHNFPNVDFGIELMQGLPGQTRETWENNFINIAPYTPIVYTWTILPNSPAGYDLDYKNKMQLKTIYSNVSFLNELRWEGWDEELLTETVISTYSYNIDDYAYFTLISQIFTDVRFNKIFLCKNRKDIISIIKNNSSLEETVQEIKQSIVEAKPNNIKKSLLKFVKKLAVDNPSYFTKSDIKEIVLNERNKIC